MVLCNHPDVDYRKACFDAYNRWILRFAEADPERLVALPQIGLRTVDEGVSELEEAKRLGFKGVMLLRQSGLRGLRSSRPTIRSGRPASISASRSRFHILTTRAGISETTSAATRSSSI